jgi:intracellular multiplication protein IcmO
MIVSLMDDVGGDGAMWKGRATAMLTGVMRALCWLRDEGALDLTVGAIRDHMNLRKVIDLADEKQYPDLPQHIRHTIKSYLSSLPGFQPEKGYRQASTTLDQHGFLEMQFTKIFGSLADVYGHIFATPFGEVDMRDVVLNRRILVVMLPALEKSSDEVANLGKVVVASLKGMMGFTIGNRLEGSYVDIVRRLGDGAPPMACFFDDVAYYCVDGMDLMAAQASPLGLTMTFGAQDVGEMKRVSGRIADTIIRAAMCVFLGDDGMAGRGHDEDHPDRPISFPMGQWPRPDRIRANHFVKIAPPDRNPQPPANDDRSVPAFAPAPVEFGPASKL